MTRRKRLDPSIFNLPIEKMQAGYYSDKYFVRAREVLLADDHHPSVLMQVFSKAHAYLGGIDEAIAILKLCSHSWTDLTVRALYDGDAINPWETVLTIEGPYNAFAHLETLYVGVLARRTRVGTNTRLVVDGTTIGWCRPVTAMPRTSRGPSGYPPMLRPHGGGVRASAPCRTR